MVAISWKGRIGHRLWLLKRETEDFFGWPIVWRGVEGGDSVVNGFVDELGGIQGVRVGVVLVVEGPGAEDEGWEDFTEGGCWLGHDEGWW